MLAVGSSAALFVTCSCKRDFLRGFTLLEIMIVLTIAGLLVAVSVPSAAKLYQSMVYRSAVGDARALLEAARYQALTQGVSVDVLVQPDTRRMSIGPNLLDATPLPEALSLRVTGAAELQRGNQTAVIRFYSDGSSSGGSISIKRNSSGGTKLHVGWLLGRVSLQPLLQE